MDSAESNEPSISPTLKLTADAGADSEEARLTASGSLARRQSCLIVVIDATPCVSCYECIDYSQPPFMLDRTKV
ncbi:hypothetical protein D3C76_1789280 [compost metagenome]